MPVGDGSAAARWCLFVVVACGFAPVAGLRGDDGDVRIVDVEVGFAGRMKVGCWTPVRVAIDGPAGQNVAPRLIAPDPDGSATTWPLPAVTLDGNGPRESRGLFRLGRIKGSVRIEAGTVSRLIEPVPDAEGGLRCDRQSVVFLGLLGPAAGFEEEFGPGSAEAAGQIDAVRDVRLLKFASPAELPETAEALDALDVLVMSRTAPLDPVRSAAVSEWVAGGGHLVLMLEHDEPQGKVRATPPPDWVPIETRGTGPFRDLAALTDRVRNNPAIEAGRSAPGGMRIRVRAGRTLVSSLDGPLVARVAYGLGRVTVFVLDWTQPPLRDWAGLPELCRYLADVGLRRTAKETPQASTQLRPTGVSDLSTQLAAQLDSFSAVQRPSYWAVLGFIVLFLLVAGPLDYLLVHYWLKRPHITWFTFPLWVALASLCGTLYANSHNAPKLESNQFDLVDIDVSTGLRRARSWMTLYSPEPRRYRVEPAMAAWLAPTPGDDGDLPRLTWSGPPETGFRGMYRAEGLELANPPYELLAGGAGVGNLPIDQWSSKALAAWWQQPADTESPLLVESDLAEGEYRLTGTVTHHLPAPITDWCLAWQKLVYVPRRGDSVLDVPALNPGEPWVPDRVVQPRVLTGFLTGETFVPSQSQDKLKQQDARARSEYDPLGDDPEPLARMLTFHDAAGGAEYTALQNDPLGRWDLSRLLDLDRAVLFGRIELPATTYRVDGEEMTPRRRTTFIRIVLPVTPASARF